MAAKRKRDYKAEYARRQARARQQGFGSYYQQRVRGGATAKPTDRPATGEELRKRSGHRSFADLLRTIREGSIVGIDPVESTRDSKGRWITVVITVLDEFGNEKSFTLSGKQLTDARIRALIDRIDEVGAISSPLYPVTKIQPPAEENDDIDQAA